MCTLAAPLYTPRSFGYDQRDPVFATQLPSQCYLPKGWRSSSLGFAIVGVDPVLAQIKAQARPAPAPAWNKGNSADQPGELLTTPSSAGSRAAMIRRAS